MEHLSDKKFQFKKFIKYNKTRREKILQEMIKIQEYENIFNTKILVKIEIFKKNKNTIFTKYIQSFSSCFIYYDYEDMKQIQPGNRYSYRILQKNIRKVVYFWEVNKNGFIQNVRRICLKNHIIKPCQVSIGSFKVLRKKKTWIENMNVINNYAI